MISKLVYYQMLRVLRVSGVSESNIMLLLSQQPNLVAVRNVTFEKMVAEVLSMGFNPLPVKFVYAIHVLGSMSKSTWENKVELLKKWVGLKMIYMLPLKTIPGL